MFVRRVRPRFRLPVPLAPDEVVARIVSRVERPGRPCCAMVSGKHRLVELRVNDEERRFWSPALSVTVGESEEEDGSVVHGMVGPNPNVWTLFAMLYMGLWTMILFAGVFGIVQWSLDQRPWALWVTSALFVALLALYVTSRVGQHLAAPQTVMLRRVLEEALDVPPAERARTERDPYHSRPVHKQ